MRIAFAFLSLIFAAAPALAVDNPKNIGTFNSWSVWKYKQKARNRCFIYSNPAKSMPAKLDHGLVSFFIRSTQRTELRSEASLQVGYPLKEKQEARLVVDGEKFRLFASGKGAWLAKGGTRERDLLEAMKVGKTMTITARSARGNETGYVFPLAGVTEAMKRLRTVCP